MQSVNTNNPAYTALKPHAKELHDFGVKCWRKEGPGVVFAIATDGVPIAVWVKPGTSSYKTLVAEAKIDEYRIKECNFPNEILHVWHAPVENRFGEPKHWIAFKTSSTNMQE